MSLAAPPPVRLGGRSDPPLGLDGWDEGGGGWGWVTVTRAADDIEAHLIVGRLSEAGIECSTLTDRSMPGTWVYGGSNPHAPVAILVRKIQFEDARIVLAEVALEAPSAPEPGSPQRPGWRNPLLWWFAAVALGVLFSALSYAGTVQSMDRCRTDERCAVPAAP